MNESNVNNYEAEAFC